MEADPNLLTQWNWQGGPTNIYALPYACPDTMGFPLEYNGWQTDGGVGFPAEIGHELSDRWVYDYLRQFCVTMHTTTWRLV